jgi:hypothetical protein
LDEPAVAPEPDMLCEDIELTGGGALPRAESGAGGAGGGNVVKLPPEPPAGLAPEVTGGGGGTGDPAFISLLVAIALCTPLSTELTVREPPAVVTVVASFI